MGSNFYNDNNVFLNSNGYNQKLNEHLNELIGRMYIFEVTKFCGYSTFVYIYKDETMLDLYNRISHHFSCQNIKGLYIGPASIQFVTDMSNNSTNVNDHCICCGDKPDHFIQIPISSFKTVRTFVLENISTYTSRTILEPIYQLPDPVVYRLYLDDGHCH
jgi:hypothetical protein